MNPLVTYAAQQGVNTITGLLTANKMRKWAIEDRDFENAYNHPKQQMQRLKEAGLNPNLVYGNGATQGNSAGISETQLGVENASVKDAIITQIEKENAKVNNALMRQKFLEMERENTYWNENPTEYARKMRSEVDILENDAYGKYPAAYKGKMTEQLGYTTVEDSDGNLVEVENKSFQDEVKKGIVEELKKQKISNDLSEKQKDFIDANVGKVQQEVYQLSEKFKAWKKDEILRNKKQDVEEMLFDYLYENGSNMIKKMPEWLVKVMVVAFLGLQKM